MKMLPEYDFSGGVRGKHYQAYHRGYKVIVHKTDGTTEIRDFALPEGAVSLLLTSARISRIRRPSIARYGD